MNPFDTSLAESPFVHNLGWTLVHSVWQVALVCIILAVLLAVLKNRSANLRYLGAYTALVLAVALPVASLLTLTFTQSTVPTSTVEPAASPSAHIPRPAAARVVVPPRISLAALGAWIDPLLPGLSLLWFAGMMATAVYNLGGWLQARRLMTRDVRPVSDQWRLRMERMCDRLGMYKPVRLLESAKAAVPMAAGCLKPVVLLPATVLTGLAPAQVEALIAHEITHIRRHDYLANLVQTALVTLLFYHPAAWWISRVIRNERELCCDDGAVALCGDKLAYARALVAAQELGGVSPGLVVASTHGSLFTRISRIIGVAQPKTHGYAPAIAGLLLVICAALGAGAGDPPVISPDQARVMGWVEDFFMHNYHDIAFRKSLEWGDVKKDEQGNFSIQYTYRASIWEKEKLIISEVFTFAPDGKFVSVQKVQGYPKKENPPDVNTKEGLQALVEEFFSNNYRDITARETTGWGEPVKHENGNASINYKGVAKIWDKDTKNLNLVFTFDKDGEFVSVEDLDKPKPPEPAAPPAPQAIATPEETVIGFTKAAMAGNIDLAQSYFVPGGTDYEDIREALQKDEWKKFFGAIDPQVPITVISKEGDENKLKVIWRVTFDKSVEFARTSYKAGTTYDLDATLKKTDKGWLIENF